MKHSLLLLLIAWGCCACLPDDPSSPPNIILIMSDDQGWGDLGISGNRNLATPNIDQLAHAGVSFDRFYVSPVCSPTRAELLTGRYHVRGGVVGTSTGGERLDLDEVTIAEVFKAAGYATAAYGKWHNGMQAPYHPNSRGFDDFYGFCSGHWGNYFDPMLEHNGKLVKGEGFVIDDFTQHGLDFIEANQAQPFFLYLPFNTPHRPMQVPDRWWEKFANKALEQLHREPEREDLLHTRAALAMCENIDWNVGRILDKVKELGLAENTIIIYLSDNGPNGKRWNDGMKGSKGSTDEGGVRSPLFMKWEGTLEAGKRLPQIASVMDLLPTLVDLTHIDAEIRNPLDGISLKPALLDGESLAEDRLIVSYWKNKISIRSQQYRLDSEDQLFDMLADPGQYQDISGEHPAILARLMTAKSTWKSTVLSELSETDDRPIPIGGAVYTQLPARDGTAIGHIERSNRSPNCTFFTNWISTEDKIIWNAEVLEAGNFEVDLFYTCPEEAIGSTFFLRFGKHQLTGSIKEAHDPPLRGMDEDRHPRGNSYVKDFKRMRLGRIRLEKGLGTLEMQATDIPGSQVMDFRLLMLRRIADDS